MTAMPFVPFLLAILLAIALLFLTRSGYAAGITGILLLFGAYLLYLTGLHWAWISGVVLILWFASLLCIGMHRSPGAH